jgi:hypothetical protein
MEGSAPAFFAGAGGDAGGLGFHAPAAGRRPAAVESWTATAADVEAWMAAAKPGDRFVYATGPTLIQGAAAALVRKLRDAGEIASHNQRNRFSNALEYVAIRNRVRVVTQRAPVCCPNMMAVLVELQNAAQAGIRCPSDSEIGARTGLTGGQVKWQLEKLEAAKMIERRNVPAPSDSRFRVVKVIATGAETAGPQ